jgi:hypothetical protein
MRCRAPKRRHGYTCAVQHPHCQRAVRRSFQKRDSSRHLNVSAHRTQACPGKFATVISTTTTNSNTGEDHSSSSHDPVHRPISCRHVILTSDVAKLVPKGRLMTEAEWREFLIAPCFLLLLPPQQKNVSCFLIF